MGNNRCLLKPWRPVSVKAEDDFDLDDDDAPNTFKTRQVGLIKTEASIRSRRARAVARGVGSIPQVETMHICAVDLALLEQEQSWGQGYEGTNKGAAIAPIIVDSVENDWTETVKV